jgi:hypothetical protein
MICAKSGYNWPSGSGERFLNDLIPLLHFCDYLPFEKDTAFYLKKKTEIPFVPSLIDFGLLALEKKMF